MDTRPVWVGSTVVELLGFFLKMDKWKKEKKAWKFEISMIKYAPSITETVWVFYPFRLQFDYIPAD